MAYLALAWKLFGFHIAVARVGDARRLGLRAHGRLPSRQARAELARRRATVLCTALYPVFFAQSSLAHLDMMVAALTIWALVFYLPPRAEALHGRNNGDAIARRENAVARRHNAIAKRRNAIARPHNAIARRHKAFVGRRNGVAATRNVRRAARAGGAGEGDGGARAL
jgi:hypothetical protein